MIDNRFNGRGFAFPPHGVFSPATSPNMSAPVFVNAAKNFTAKHIDPADLNRIMSLYGENVQDVYELGAGQKWMFEKGKNNKSAFFMQMMLKAEIDIDPFSFRQKVQEVCSKRETLRFAYVHKQMKKPYSVELKYRKAELHFDDLSDVSVDEEDARLESLCDADRRRGFDLEKDPLIRIRVYKLCGEKRHAIMISQPHINSDGTSIGLLIKDIFIDYVLKIPDFKQNDLFSYKKYAEYLETIDKKAELDYWKGYLDGIPEHQPLPGAKAASGEFSEMVHFVPFSPETEKALQEAQKRYKTTVYNILQASWGIMMNRITGSEDVIFGAISSGRDPGMYQCMDLVGGFIKVLPVRVKVTDDTKFSALVKQIQSEFAKSMGYSHCSPEEIEKVLGRQEPVFNHILNCHNFIMDAPSKSGGMGIPGFNVIGGSMYDNLSEDLSVYFRSNVGAFGYIFSYNADVLSKETILLYSECFEKTLAQILSQDDIRIGDIEKCDPEMFEYTKNADLLKDLKKSVLLKRLQSFSSISEDDLIKLAKTTYVKSYLENDTIFDSDDIMDSVAVVVKGKVELWRNKFWWNNPLRIVNEGTVLSYSGLIAGAKAERTAIAYSDNCEVLYIPQKSIIELMKRYPDVGLSVVKELWDLYGRYEKLWMTN